jgi:hypothetical protein
MKKKEPPKAASDERFPDLVLDQNGYFYPANPKKEGQ